MLYADERARDSIAIKFRAIIEFAALVYFSVGNLSNKKYVAQ